MSLTPQQIKAAFFAVLETDAAGATVRAALGAGADSVINKSALNRPLPTAPFIVLWWNSQPSGGGRRQVLRYYPAWAMYDIIDKDYYRIEGLEALIRAAYPADAIPYCHVDFLPVRDLIDMKLNNMPARSFPMILSTR